MAPSASSVPEGALAGTPESGYLWTCSMCGGLGLVEEEGKLVDCPKCETARRFGIAFELVRRNMTPVIPATEQFASPAVGAPSFVYEVWKFFIEEGTARRVVVEDDVGAAYTSKWDLEEAAYGPIEKRMGS
ncbi:MAG: hypothetical protein LC740_18680 [Actinobacteria bacterium]|nr:hypothetical protein [Actinomycetota bacterium]